MVTYEQLFDTLRREKSRDELQILESGFYNDVKRFLAEKRTASVSEQGQKALIEYQNAQRILRELYDRRERKILTLAMHKTRTDAAVIDSESLQPEERQLFDTIVTTLTSSRKDVLFGDAPPAPVQPEPETAPEVATPEEPETEDTVNVTFASSVPKFVGKDLTVYGPYEEGQQAALPQTIAKILVQKGRASTS